MAVLLQAGMSHELLDLARELGHQVVGLCDPACAQAEWHGMTVYRSDEDALAGIGEIDGVIIAIDLPAPRRQVQQRYQQAGLRVHDLIGGHLGPGTTHGAGLVIARLAHLSVDGRVGQGVRLNVGANVMHDAVLGDFVTLAPGAVVLGRVTVGSLTYVGANATILPDLTVGSGVTIGAGAVVTRDVADGATVKGVPARA